MRRHDRRRFRPTLDGSLEDRIALSAAQAAAAGQAPVVAPAPVPSVTPRTYHHVMTQIDQAFAQYQQQTGTPWKSLQDSIDHLASDILHTSHSGNPTAQTSSNTNVRALLNRLENAGSQLPDGLANLSPAFQQTLGALEPTPQNLNSVRNRIKGEVHHYVTTSLQQHQIRVAPENPATPIQADGNS